MRKLFYLIASISALVVALSIAYYLIVFLPNKERSRQELEQQKIQFETQKLEKEKKEKSTRQFLLQECLEFVNNNFTENWNSGCKQLGRPDECNLPALWSDDFEERLQDEKDDCFKRFSN